MINTIVEQLSVIDPLVFYIAVALISIVILSKAADMLVYGISNYAKRLGISDYLIGFIVVSIATALPELVASLNGAMLGEGGIVFGTIFGSNLFKIPLLGLLLIVGKKLKTAENTLGVAPVITLIIITLPLLLVLDGNLSRIDGIILLCAFAIYITRLWRKEGILGKMKEDVKIKNIYKEGIIFLLALSALLISGRLLITSSITISDLLDIPPYFIGLIVIGIGASMPELTVQLRSFATQHHSLAFGNVFGSLVANSALVLGITALINPFTVDKNLLWIAMIIMVAGITYTLFLMEQEKVTWKNGVVLMGIYLFFLIAQIIFR
ncbi:MAG: hypothetical protein ABIJ08_02285 [Nanoarchaeota archaeon]